MKTGIFLILILIFSNILATESSFKTKEVDFKLIETPLSAFLLMVAKKSDLELVMGPGINGNISYNLLNITPHDALLKVTQDHGLEFIKKDNILFVNKKVNSALVNDNQITATKILSDDTGITYIPVKYTEAKETAELLKPLMLSSDQLLVNEGTNSITLVGSKISAQKIIEYLKNTDLPPTQIIIEAQIIEMTKNISREFGVSLGDLTNANLDIDSGSKGTVVSKSSRGLSPNGSLGISMGSIAGKMLQTRIDAAEQSGEAKVISKPKVATLNNLPATINSGVTFNVKTASSSTTGVTAPGSIQSIKAGLTLTVTPSILGTVV